MTHKFGRREFLLLGSATAGSLLLKSCATAPTPSTSMSPTSATGASAPAVSGDAIKVGILHSLTGTMAISEKSVVDAEMLAIEEINKAGGVLEIGRASCRERVCSTV